MNPVITPASASRRNGAAVLQLPTGRNGSAAAAAQPEPRVLPGPALTPEASDVAVWVYAVTAGHADSRINGVTGVAGEPVRAVAAADLSAVVGTVDESTGRPLASLLASLPAIETAGRAHHQVIAHLAGTGPVVPLRFATVYPDDATIGNLLAQRSVELTLMLESFRGRQEWDVKIYVGSGPDGSSTDSPWGIFAAERAERIGRALSSFAVATRRRPVSAPVTGGAPRMVVDGAYLLDTERAQEFARIVNSASAEDPALRAELSGPWPPYSFADR